jgi:hypothetical protein
MKERRIKRRNNETGDSPSSIEIKSMVLYRARKRGAGRVFIN